MSKRKRQRRRGNADRPVVADTTTYSEGDGTPVAELVGLLPDEAWCDDLMDRFYVIDYDGQQVTYRQSDDDTGQGTVVTCSALDFISRVVQEIVAAGPAGTEGE